MEEYVPTSFRYTMREDFTIIISCETLKIDFMKKDQLKLGMVVETRNKNRYLLVLINDMRVFINKNYFCQRLENYFSDLYYESDSNFDIMKVYQIDVFNSLDDIDDDVMLKLLWERKEPVEITMEQIAEKFGLPVDMIKIKKPKE